MLGASYAVSVFAGNPLGMGGGHSFVWLAWLYALGACFRRFGIPRLDSRVAIVVFLCVSATIGWIGLASASVQSPGLLNSLLAQLSDRVALNYVSPLVLINAVAIFVLFSRYSPGRFAGIVKKLTPGVFGVYLVHMHPLVADNVLMGALSWAPSLGGFGCVLAVVLTWAVIFSVSLCLSMIRVLLFRRLGIVSWASEHLGRLCGRRLPF